MDFASSASTPDDIRRDSMMTTGIGPPANRAPSQLATAELSPKIRLETQNPLGGMSEAGPSLQIESTPGRYAALF